MRWNRLAASAGIGYVLLAFVEFFGPSFPQTSDPARLLDSYFVSHRTWTLTTVVVQGIGNAVWLVFLCGLALLIRRAGSTAAGPVALVGGRAQRSHLAHWAGQHRRACLRGRR